MTGKLIISMKIDESVVEKNISVEKEDPYGFSLKFMEKAAEFGQVIERRNEYLTDGPEHRSRVEFDVVGVLDAFSRLQISVMMESTQKNLRANITGSFDVDMDEPGFMSSMLSEFYLENIYPAVRKISIEKLRAVEKIMEAEIGR